MCLLHGLPNSGSPSPVLPGALTKLSQAADAWLWAEHHSIYDTHLASVVVTTILQLYHPFPSMDPSSKAVFSEHQFIQVIHYQTDQRWKQYILSSTKEYSQVLRCDFINHKSISTFLHT